MSFCIEWRFSVVLSSVLKQLQPVWRKYQVLNNKNFCSTFSRLWCLIFIIWRGGSIEIGRLRSRILDVDGQGCGGSWKLDNFQVCHMCIIPSQWEESYYCTDFRSLLNCVSCVGPWVSRVTWVAWGRSYMGRFIEFWHGLKIWRASKLLRSSECACTNQQNIG